MRQISLGIYLPDDLFLKIGNAIKTRESKLNYVNLEPFEDDITQKFSPEVLKMISDIEKLDIDKVEIPGPDDLHIFHP